MILDQADVAAATAAANTIELFLYPEGVLAVTEKRGARIVDGYVACSFQDKSSNVEVSHEGAEKAYVFRVRIGVSSEAAVLVGRWA